MNGALFIDTSMSLNITHIDCTLVTLNRWATSNRLLLPDCQAMAVIAAASSTWPARMDRCSEQTRATVGSVSFTRILCFVLVDH